jgi:predicted GIY-YIG superfamily endonuclease
MKTKKCPKCGIEKPLNAKHYYRNASKASGFQSRCKVCRNSYDSDRLEYKADYYQKNKEKYAEHDAKYYQENRDMIIARNREWIEQRKKQEPGCVYQILNKNNGKVYIGETTRGKLRWKQHLRALKGKYHENHKLQEDYDKFGEEVFEWSILKELPKDKDTLLLEEIKMIDKLMKEGKDLYNLTLTVDQLQMLQEDK